MPTNTTVASVSAVRNFAVVLASALTALIFASAPAAAQVIAHPNQIVGEIRFTNVNPVIVQLLDDPGSTPGGQSHGMASLQQPIGESLPPQVPRLQASSWRAPASRLSTPYQLTVESGPPGLGIAYLLSNYGAMGTGGSGSSYYRFAGQSSAPVEYEPAPDVTVDLAECAGIVRFTFEDRNGNPLVPTGGSATAHVEDPPGSGTYSPIVQSTGQFKANQSEQVLVTRGDGLPHKVVVRVQTGTDPYFDLLFQGFEIFPTVSCDEVVEIKLKCTAVGSGGGAGLGQVTGVIDILGEAEHDTGRFTWMKAEEGPWNNLRYDHVAGSPASGAFTLRNMMPSTVLAPSDFFKVSGEMVFRGFRRFQHLMTPSVQVEVLPDTTVDLGETFVLDPGTLSGDIFLLGPPVLDPTIGSTLEDLRRNNNAPYDPNGVGLANSRTLYGSAISIEGSKKTAPGATRPATDGWATVQIEGDYDPLVETFMGDYQFALGGLDRQAAIWERTRLHLSLTDTATPSVPESYQTCWSTIGHRGSEHVIVPGGAEIEPMRFCLSQVNLRYRSIGRDFISPWANANGSFAGLDFEATPADYTASATGDGTPNKLPAASTGLVVLTMAQGTYNIDPKFSVINPDRTTSSVGLNPVALTVGCRQVLDVWTDFWLALDPVPVCTSQSQALVAGVVKGAVAIDRIEYYVDGVGPTVYCSSCGIEPALSLPVTLGSGRTAITIAAVDVDGRATTIRSWIDYFERPGDLGNVLLATHEQNDLRFWWRGWPGSRSSELVKDVDKRFTAPVSEVVASMPTEEVRRTNKLRSSPDLHFYRVRGINCPGDAGP